MTVERFPIEAGHILMFARAIADPNPIYADPVYAAGSEFERVIAPPTFLRASAQFDPDWPLRPKFGEPWIGSGRTPTGVPRGDGGEAGTSLHAEQHFEYHRIVRAGDVLHATERPGRRWEKQGRRGGMLRFAETIIEFRDEEDGLAVTMRSVSVRTEQVVTVEEER
jgi:acyl dehydratase